MKYPLKSLCAVLCSAVIALAGGCSEDDVDQDQEQEQEQSTAAYFLVDTSRVGTVKDGIGCDLSGDGKIDNITATMLKQLQNLNLPGVKKKDPNVALQEAIDTGRGLAVMEFFGVEDFENDEEFTLRSYRGEYEGYSRDAEERAPESLFSGQGEILITSEAYTETPSCTIVNGTVEIPESEIRTSLPIGDQVYDVALQRGKIVAQIGKTPGSRMLGGSLVDGIICGAIQKDTAVQLILQYGQGKYDALKGPLKMLFNGIADLECEGKAKNCLSIGMAFTATSVEIKS